MQIIRSIENRIYEVRGERVMLDRDLAALYETETKALNLAVRRNLKRFPEDFMFPLTKEEVDILRFQFETSKS
jgi:ORF6N domain